MDVNTVTKSPLNGEVTNLHGHRVVRFYKSLDLDHNMGVVWGKLLGVSELMMTHSNEHKFNLTYF